MLTNIITKFKKIFYSKILGKKYIRTGKCNCCGSCCQHIYVKHGNGFIKDEEQFEGLKPTHYFYGFLNVLGKDEIGLIFECTKLDKTTNHCMAYEQRALICRSYPQEEIFMLGGSLSEKCGFTFTPINSFDEIFTKVQKRKDLPTQKFMD